MAETMINASPGNVRVRRVPSGSSIRKRQSVETGAADSGADKTASAGKAKMPMYLDQVNKVGGSLWRNQERLNRSL
jgi:hypothetical protein